MRNPCQHCQDRYPCCHDKCQKYTEWKAAYQAAKDADSARTQYGVMVQQIKINCIRVCKQGRGNLFYRRER